MGCDVSDEVLWSWIDRDEPALHDHLATCPACRGKARLIRQQIQLLATDPPRPVPEAIGPYKIRKLLGEGGQAVVYEAEQPSPRRSVALKVLKGGRFASKKHIRQFVRETQSLARLQHPAIAAIFEAGRTDEGQYYFAMELVEGTPLDAYLHQSSMSREDRLELFRRICEAVHHAHEHGIVHRDLKPSNILIGASGEPKILDFGLARITDSDLQATMTATQLGRVEGTPRYMSPEQADGRLDAVDARSDQYSLGIILFEMLTGRSPFEVGEITPQTLQTIRDDPPLRPSRVDDHLRGDLDAVILKTLEKNPDWRYPSVAELERDVERHLHQELVLARPVSRARVLAHRLQRRWRLLTLVGLLIAAVSLAVSLGPWRSWPTAVDPYPGRRELADLRCRLLMDPGDALAIEMAQASEVLYSPIPEAILVYCQAEVLSGNPGIAIDFLDDLTAQDRLLSVGECLETEIKQRQGMPTELVDPRPPAGLSTPEAAEFWYLSSFATLDPTRALLRAREALQHDPHHLLALQVVSKLCEYTGDLECALAHTTTMLREGAPEYASRRDRATLLMRLRRFPEARAEWGRLIESAPEDEYGYVARGWVNRISRDYDLAVADFTRAIEIVGGDKHIAAWKYYHRGTPNWILGDRAEAASDYRRAYQLLTYPTFANARLFLVLHELGRREEATDMLREARRRVTDDWLARILACLDGDLTPDELVDAVKPDDRKRLCEGTYYAGEVCLLNGDEDAARDWFRRCLATGLDLDPDSPTNPMSEYELAEWRMAGIMRPES